MNLKNFAPKNLTILTIYNIRMRRAEFRSVEDVENIHLLAMQALSIGASDESESTTCESVHKAYSLQTVGSLQFSVAKKEYVETIKDLF